MALRIGNPFRVLPALKFGAVFAIILFATKAAAIEVGGNAVYWASALGGSLDVDSVAVSVADLLSGGKATLPVAFTAVMLALGTNAILKTSMAFFAGGARFGWRVAAGFVAMFGAGLLAMALLGGMMALEPVTVQCMPARLSRVPMATLQPASTTPEEVHRPWAWNCG